MVSRIATLLVVAGSFGYVPFILREENIVAFFVRITSVFVTPLMTVYVMGALTAVNRRSGLIGLIVGPAYGLAARMLGPGPDSPGVLPFWLTDKFAAYLWSAVITACSMLLSSAILGWQRNAALSPINLVGWLKSTQQELPEIVTSPFAARGVAVPRWANPNLWAMLLLAVSATLVFCVFW